jgi:DNA-binding response OmpR family regulator
LSNVLLLTSGREPPADILPSLSLLPHTVRVAPAAVEHVITGPAPDAVLVDARRDLVLAKRVLLALRVAATSVPVIAVVTDGGWAAVSADWGADDLLLHTAGPGEVEARLRLAIGRRTQTGAQLPDEIRSGGLVVNEATYSARINGRSLDLTFKEFELLKFLASTRAGCSPGLSCCRRSGVTTTSAARGQSTCTSGDCGPSSARRTRR